MDVAAASEDTGTLQALKALDSLESKLNQVQVAYQQFYTSIGVESVWKGFLDGVKTVIDTLNGLPKVFGKVPLGAVAAVANMISLVKNLLLSGVATIATQWREIMNKSNGESDSSAQTGGTKIGNTWITALVNAIKGRQPEVQQAMDEAVGKASKNIEGQVAPNSGNTNTINTSSLKFTDDTIRTSNEELNQVATTYATTLTQMQVQGANFSAETQWNLAQIFKSLKAGDISLKEAGEQAIQVINNTGATAENNTGKVTTFWDSLKNKNSDWSRGLTGLAQSLTTIGMLLDKSSESGRVLSGVLTGIGGALQTGVAAAQVFSGNFAALPQLVMGVFNVINGMDIGWENDTERLERLTKEAENLTNESKKAKAEYNTLQRTADKLDELKEKRYESAEAEQAYQDAMQELGEAYPQLISYMDELGNITITDADLDNALAKAREKTAQATIDAINSEIEAKKQEQKTKEDEAKGQRREAITNSQLLVMMSDVYDYHSIQPDSSDERVNKEFARSVRKIDSNVENSTSLGDGLSEVMLRLYENNEDYAFLENYIRKGLFGTSFDENAFIEDIQSDKWINGIGENYKSVAKDLQNLYQKSSQVPEIIQEVVSDYETLNGMSDEELDTEDGQKKLLNLRDNLQQLAKLESFEEYSDSIQEIVDLFGESTNSFKAAAEIGTQIKGLQRGLLSNAINNLDTETEGLESFLKSPELISLAVKQLETKSEGYEGSAEDFVNENIELLKIYNDFYDKLAASEKEKFTQMMQNSQDFTFEDFFRAFTGIPEQMQDALHLFFDQYNTRDQIKQYLQQKIDKGEDQQGILQAVVESFENTKQEYSQLEEEYLINFTNQYSSMLDHGLSTEGREYGIAAFNLLQELQSEDIDPVLEEAVLKLIKEKGLSTKEGLETIVATLQSDYDLENDSDIIKYLTTMQDSIVSNLLLSAQASISDFSEKWKDDSKIFSKLESGIGLEDLGDFISQANLLDGIQISTQDFSRDGDKYILAAEKARQYMDAYIAQLRKEGADLNNFASKLEGIINESGEIDLTALGNFVRNEQANGTFVATLQQLGIDTSDETLLNQETGNLTLEGVNLLKKNIPSYIASVNDFDYMASQAAEEIVQNAEFIEGNYDSLKVSITDLHDIASGEIKLEKNAYAKQKAKESINTAYNSLISDILSKGFENINLADYQGLVKGDKAAIQSAIDAKDYTAFVEKYASWAGKTIEETNDLIIQAIEKDSASKTGAAADALKDITFTPTGKFASLDTIGELVNALNIPINDLLGNYIDELDAYSIKEDIDLSSIDNFAEIVADSLQSFIDSIVDAVGKGISGKLSNADVTNLRGNLRQAGLGETADSLTFKQTAEGLKLSEQSAIDLYRAISSIDALQGRLVFDDLRKSLEVPGSAFENISTTSAKVAEVQREIATLDTEIASITEKQRKDGEELSKADEERIAALERQKGTLQQQLQLAQEIQRAQSMDADSYDFMNRKLPEYLEGPQNYWNSVGEAYKAMNESATSGYMEIDDFYNIINEMSNLMSISGNSIEFMGETIDGSAESAAALIEKGLGALSNVDGEGVKIDLSKLGLDLQTGASNMGEGFDGAVKEMARSQIKMLDGMIKLLETVVAMEELGDIDVDGDNVFSIGDLFQFDDNGEIQRNEEGLALYTQDFTDYAAKVLEAAAASDEYRKSLETFKINGVSLYEMFEDAIDGIKDIPMEEDLFFDALNAIVTAAKSGDYNLEDLSSIQEILAGTGQVIEVEAGDGTSIVVGYGAVVEKNEKGEYVYNGQTYDTAEEATRVAALDGMGATDIETEQFDEEIHVTGKLTIGKQEVEVEQTKDGLVYHSNIEGIEGNFTSLEDMIDAEWKSLSKIDKLEFGNDKDTYIDVAYGAEIRETINAKSIEVISGISQTQKNALRNATTDEINKVLNTEGTEEVEKRYGIKLTGEITEDDMPEILTNAGIETKDIKINLTVTGEDKEVAEKLLAETTDPVTLTVNLTKGDDATGLFDEAGEDGNLTRNVTITFNDGTQLTLDVAGVDTNGETWTIKGVTSETPNVDLGEAEIVGITFNDGWTLNGAVTANGVDLGAATVSNLSSNGDGSWTLTTSVGGSIVLTADEISGLLNNDLTLAQDATGQLTLTANVSKYGAGFKNGMPVTEATLEVETEVPDLDVTMDAATETVDAWFDGLQGREIKASFSVEPDGTVNSRGLGRNSEVIYNNTSGGATRADTSVDTSGINDFVEAAKQAGQEVSDVAAAMDTIESTNVEAIQSAQQAIKTDKIDDVRDTINNIDPSNITTAQSAINTIDPSKAITAKRALDNIRTSFPLNIELKVTSSGAVNVGSINSHAGSSASLRLNATKAKGDVALAKGKGTLMGELGEELVVSGGRYFLAGSNGPEFVDLAADAIVFNHLQTKRLLQNGYANGRGKPITNERRATAFAHGNVEGPALASASQALAALRQIRAMWQSMLDASSRDLGSRAGSGGGGGGGGGGGNGNTFVPKNATHEIQRWYNLLRQIEKLERDITYQESLRNKYENDRIVNGTKIYKSYQDELRFLNQEIDRQKELVDLQRSWYDQAAAQLEASDYGKIFTYNENGLMQYRGNSMPGSGEGLDILENLNRRDVYGRAIDNAETAQKQLAYLQSIGFAIDNLKYNDDGTTVAEQRNGKFVKVEKDENGNDVEKDLTNEELSQVYVDMMNNFWDNLDGWRDELDSLYDNVIDTENSIVENQVKQNEIVQKIVDNQIDVENKVLQAIEDMRQAEIDAAQEERDVFADAADKMINGLNDALNKERQMYQNNENQKDIEKLQRQLAILQRSGGSGSQIQNLQQQLNAKQQDQYFNERQQQIDAIKEASDKQIEKMDRQIELMTETLDYQKENGLLWGQVYDILSKPAAEVWQFIANNSKELQAASALQQEQEYINTMDKLEVYDADRKAAEDMAAGVQGSILDGVGAVSQFNAGEAYTAQKSDTDIEALTRKMDELKQAFEFQQGVDSVDLSESGDTDDSSGGSGGSSGTRKSFKDKVAAAQQENLTWWQRSANAISEKANEKIKTAKTVATTANAVTGVVNAIAKVSDVVNKVTNSLTKKTNSVDTTSAKRRISGTVKYATGGLNTQTGWAWLDGTPSKPEYVLNPEQTEILRDSLINRNPATASLNSAAYSSRADMANGSTYSTINNDSGVNIESVQMNLNVPAINNDYDAKRAGEMAMNEMLRIARKTGNRSLSRR